MAGRPASQRTHTFRSQPSKLAPKPDAANFLKFFDYAAVDAGSRPDSPTFSSKANAATRRLAPHQIPDTAVEVIRGDTGPDERGEARRRFERSSRFLVSTEAGGEGVNLQKSCHSMVNYDLPWNPMRLQQRIGRLDRYGQRERVRVFNLRVPGFSGCSHLATHPGTAGSHRTDHEPGGLE